MFAGLSLDQAPPFNAPIKFFLIAPIFAIVAGLVILFGDFSLLSHDNSTIALLHLLSIGFIVMVMFGALQQMLPVVAGAVIPKAQLVANITFGLILSGVITFTLGFIFYHKILLFSAASFLLLGLLFFSSIALFALLKIKNKTPIVWAIILSIVFFFVTFLLGTHLIISHATTNISPIHYELVNLHLSFAFFGWVFMLICGITFQVVPMFWVSDPFDKKLQVGLIGGIIFALVTLVLNFNLMFQTIISLVMIIYSFTTLQKLNNRKRKLKDQSVIYWKIAIYFLLLATIYWGLQIFFSFPNEILAILAGGFILSLINGMLYKIIPFLVWFHLSAKGIFDIPTMKEMIKNKNIERQRYFHILFFITLIIGIFLQNNIMIKLSALFFVISNVYLIRNFMSCVKIYIQKNKRA